MELGHIADIDIIEICAAIVAPLKQQIRSTVLRPSPPPLLIYAQRLGAWEQTLRTAMTDMSYLALTLPEHLLSLCGKDMGIHSILYIDIQPKYIGIPLLVHIAPCPNPHSHILMTLSLSGSMWRQLNWSTTAPVSVLVSLEEKPPELL